MTVVDVDLNHPMAGKDLHFDVEIVEVREANEDEVQHGHVHGDGGHHRRTRQDVVVDPRRQHARGQAQRQREPLADHEVVRLARIDRRARAVYQHEPRRQ